MKKYLAFALALIMALALIPGIALATRRRRSAGRLPRSKNMERRQKGRLGYVYG